MDAWIVDAALTIVPELGLRVSTHTQTGVVLWTRGGCATSHVWALNRDNVCWPALVYGVVGGPPLGLAQRSVWEVHALGLIVRTGGVPNMQPHNRRAHTLTLCVCATQPLHPSSSPWLTVQYVVR